MKAIVLDDTSCREALFPFADIRHVADIRVGILTIRERWETISGGQVFCNDHENQGKSSVEPEPQLVYPANIIISRQFIDPEKEPGQPGKGYVFEDSDIVKTIHHPWDIFKLNDWAIRQDFELLTAGRNTEPIPETVQVTQVRNIFIETGAKLHHCILNASGGPIYIGKDAEIMEGSTIRGPFALGEGSTVKMGSRIYGATTIGPFCTVGGEIKNSVIFGYSNKAHEGYLGDSVIGEWCNLGAGTSGSNVKNTAGTVKVWDNRSKQEQPVGLKCGLLMGDYSRSAINTSFNTGTVVGISVNVFGNGLTPKYIPSFSWGCNGNAKYKFEKAINDIRNWKKLKNRELTQSELEKLKHIFDQR